MMMAAAGGFLPAVLPYVQTYCENTQKQNEKIIIIDKMFFLYENQLTETGVTGNI